MSEHFTVQEEDNQPLLRDDSEIPVNEEPTEVDEPLTSENAEAGDDNPSDVETGSDQYNFTTTEQAIADGAFKLDQRGRMPGIYLDELEEADRIRRGELIQKAHDEADANGIQVVEKQVNVSSSPIPPITVLEPQLVKDEVVTNGVNN